MSNLFLSLPAPEPLGCEILECENDATWVCHPQGVLTVSIHLCDECKQEAEQQEALRLGRLEGTR